MACNLEVLVLCWSWLTVDIKFLLCREPLLVFPMELRFSEFINIHRNENWSYSSLNIYIFLTSWSLLLHYFKLDLEASIEPNVLQMCIDYWPPASSRYRSQASLAFNTVLVSEQRERLWRQLYRFLNYNLIYAFSSLPSTPQWLIPYRSTPPLLPLTFRNLYAEDLIFLSYILKSFTFHH